MLKAFWQKHCTKYQERYQHQKLPFRFHEFEQERAGVTNRVAEHHATNKGGDKTISANEFCGCVDQYRQRQD